MSYNHGTYGQLMPTGTYSEESPSLVAYIGTAPIHKIAGQSKTENLVNYPLKITSLNVARNLLGYTEKADFSDYTLCEAVEAHFKNNLENVGPIYCINILDPAENATPMEEALSFPVQKKQVAFTLGDLVLDSMTVEVLGEEVAVEGEEGTEVEASPELVEGVDYKMVYDSSSDTVTITFTGSNIPTMIAIKGDIVDPTVEASQVIGAIDLDGKKSGLKVLQDIFPKSNEVVNVLAAPGFSEIPEVYEAMISAVQKINGHWDAYVNADIPMRDGDTSIKSISKAIEWKEDHSYDSGLSKVYWPQSLRKDGKVFHLSTLASAKMQALDSASNGVPYISVSNQVIDAADQYHPDGLNPFDVEEANKLNEKGITTLIRWGGAYRLWGPHTAAYSYNEGETEQINPVYDFDTSIRTMLHITNSFQKDNFDDIDSPMTPNLKDVILHREQSKLDTLKCMGALLGEPKIYFSDDNSATSIMGGNFIWDIQATTTMPFKSGTVRLGYTNDGVYTLLNSDEEE